MYKVKIIEQAMKMKAKESKIKNIKKEYDKAMADPDLLSNGDGLLHYYTLLTKLKDLGTFDLVDNKKPVLNPVSVFNNYVVTKNSELNTMKSKLEEKIQAELRAQLDKPEMQEKREKFVEAYTNI